MFNNTTKFSSPANSNSFATPYVFLKLHFALAFALDERSAKEKKKWIIMVPIQNPYLHLANGQKCPAPYHSPGLVKWGLPQIWARQSR